MILEWFQLTLFRHAPTHTRSLVVSGMPDVSCSRTAVQLVGRPTMFPTSSRNVMGLFFSCSFLSAALKQVRNNPSGGARLVTSHLKRKKGKKRKDDGSDHDTLSCNWGQFVSPETPPSGTHQTSVRQMSSPIFLGSQSEWPLDTASPVSTCLGVGSIETTVPRVTFHSVWW
jgi:hypothetical protein